MRAARVVVLCLFAAGCGTAEPVRPAVPFSLDAPKSLEMLKAESATLDVAVKWEPSAREDLLIGAAIEPEGRGVSVKAVRPRLDKGAGPAQVSVTATETAAVGDYLLTVTAKGDTSGSTAKATVSLKVRGD